MSRNKFPKNTPARIFLVMGDEDVTPEDNFLELDEITWCSEKVFKTDIEYVRKDLYDAVKRKLEKAEERGFHLCKEQMLKDAVEGKVVELGGTYHDLSVSVDCKELNEALQPLGLKDGDKVKVVIVKEEEK